MSTIKVNEIQDIGGNVIISSNGSGTFTSSLGGGDLADDTTPQLGGNLDLNGNTIQGNGNLNISNGTVKLAGNHPEGSNNTAMGGDAGNALTTGSGSNTLIGSRAGYAITTGLNNIAIGRNSLDANLTSGNNVAVGSSAGSLATGADNTFVGDAAGSSVTTGSNVTVIGRGAQASSATVTNEVTLGNTSVTVLRTNGSIMPFTDNAQDLGSPSLQWQNMYTGDLHLSNERHKEGNSVDGTTGNWTIQEGAENLYIINNKNGKKFKFSLEEIK